MITIEQAADIMAITTDTRPKVIRSNFIAGAYWMKAQILQFMNEASLDYYDEQKEVIDQFCNKIYEQLKEIEK